MKYCARIALTESGSEVFGPETLELLKCIDTQKSVKEAASTLKISTAKAWKLIRAMEKHLKEPAVVKSRGGADSYDVHISPAARKLLEKFEDFEKKSQSAIADFYKQIF
ncbi:MAG: LysR family transcriptional regulator [Spirochaetales bacterium]|nr:LysR family transcriptional regulator [Spirochaetales bacterium]